MHSRATLNAGRSSFNMMSLERIGNSLFPTGVGKPDESVGRIGQIKPGLGTSIVKALADQLEARVEVASSSRGTTVSLTYATFTSRVLQN